MLKQLNNLLNGLKNYENVEEPKKEELTPEEVEKEMEKLKAKFEPKTKHQKR